MSYGSASHGFIGCETRRLPGRFDLAAALTATADVTALVYGFIRAAAEGWGDNLTLAAFGAAAILLTLFAVTETRARQPITPLRLRAGPAAAGRGHRVLAASASSPTRHLAPPGRRSGRGKGP